MSLRIKLKRFVQYAAPALLVAVIFFGVLLYKGIFPFGEARIDYYDMGQTNAPLYYHIWDFLHGKSPLFYDWYINEGQNLSMGNAIQWNISPFNLFFLFIPRSLVMKSLSVFMGLRLSAMALVMYVFLTKIFKKSSYLIRFVAATAYGLCGYTLTHYTITTYLDMTVFVPLLALGLYRLLKYGKAYFYMLILGFTTALSYYFGFMHLIYILLFSGIWIMIYMPSYESGEKLKELQRDRIWKIAAGTVGGLALSAVMLVPAVAQMMLSSRFNSNLSSGPLDTIKMILNSVGADEYYVKGWQLFGLECALAIIIYGAFKLRKERRRTLTVLLMVFIPTALIPFESINILWHFGTYYHYPIRCGYLIPFAILTGMTYFATRLEICRALYLPQMVFAAVVSAVFAFGTLVFYFSRESWIVQELYAIWRYGFTALLVVYFICILIHKRNSGVLKKFGAAFIVILPVAELVIGAVIGYGLPRFTDKFFADPEQSGEYVQTSLELKDKLALNIDESADRLQRIKNPDTDLNADYGMVLGRATISGWANTVTNEQQKSSEHLGYSTHFMRILDAGGTFFTDSLLGVTDVITRVPFEGEAPVYEKTGEADTSGGKYYLFHNNASFPSAIAVSGDISEYTPEDMKLADAQNYLYKVVSGKDEDILESLGREESGKDVRTISISGNKALYLRKGKAQEIQVNGETIPVPTISDMENTEYPAWFNNDLLYLGSYSNEEIEVKCSKNSYLFLLDLDRLQALSDELSGVNTEVKAEKTGLEVKIEGSESKNMALIPLHCDPGFRAVVNGKVVKTLNIAGIFTGIPIEAGENDIEITFSPAGFKDGAFLSALAGVVIAGLYVIGRRKKLVVAEALKTITAVIYKIAWGAAGAVFYIIPVLWFFIHQIIKRL
ncbi:MAG: YfhO family protein [Lachnospiraceae bacterium]|nr:YfhO family protein [Lachnospiraceae bacterium]